MFELQGHRGARGLAPENTLAAFEIALDCGVDSIETDVHLTRDDVPVLIHDPRLGPDGPLVREVTLAQLRDHRVPGPAHRPTPRAERFAQERGVDIHGIPTLEEFFAFAATHGKLIVTAHPSPGTPGEGRRVRAENSVADGAALTPNPSLGVPEVGSEWPQLIFDLELKRVPFHPETIGDGYTGIGPGTLERLVVAAIRQAGVGARTRVRSFDHRCVSAVKLLAPALQTALLVHHTVPADLRAVLGDADVYCPDYLFVDAEIVRQVHAVGKRIIPYTVNEPRDCQRLIEMGVDGVTTDYPDRLLASMSRSI